MKNVKLVSLVLAVGAAANAGVAAADTADDLVSLICNSTGTCTLAKQAGTVNILPDPLEKLANIGADYTPTLTAAPESRFRAYRNERVVTMKVYNGWSTETYIMTLSRATDVTSDTQSGAAAKFESTSLILR